MANHRRFGLEKSAKTGSDDKTVQKTGEGWSGDESVLFIVGGLIFVALRQNTFTPFIPPFFAVQIQLEHLYRLLVNLINFELKCQAHIALAGQGC